MPVLRIGLQNKRGDMVLAGLCERCERLLEEADAALLEVHKDKSRCNLCGSNSKVKREVGVRITRIVKPANPSDCTYIHAILDLQEVTSSSN
jgi:hypothetical protein